MDEFVPQRTSAYIGQHDLHIGEMTVRETLSFLILVFVLCWCIHRLYQIVNSLRQSIHILGGTALIALLQPAPETYDLFDDILLLSEGQIVYQGPRESVLEFFEEMGFKCPERKCVADFLQEVRTLAYRYVSVNEFAEAFQSFPVGRKLGEELSTPFDRSRNHPAALTTSKYGISKPELLKACISREWLLMKRNSFVYIFKLVQLIILGTIAMTVFLRTKMHRRSVEDGVIYLGAMFLGLVTHLFNGFAELAMSIAKLPIFYKQRDLLFYPSWAYALPTWILKIPISFLECAVWILMTYYIIGFDPNIERFFRHYLLLVLISQMASGLFRLLAAVGREMVVADTFGSFAQLVLLILGGFLISRGLLNYFSADDIKKWWTWGYWSSPLMYAQNAVAVNEFLGHSWQKVVNATASNDTLGVQVLKARGIFVDSNWYWIGVGALLGYIFLFNILFVLFLNWLDPLGKGQTVISEETLREKHANRTGETVELLPARADSSKPGLSEGRGGRISAVENNKKGMVLPFVPLSITFDNVKYSVDMPQMFIEEVMELVELTSLRGALVGLPGVSGLSTEQRKRLTIAVELVANPSIIFMDEPTSGLDARAAAIVMRTVRNTVDTGRTVVCTIHQPSIDIFEAFDELFLMKRGGEEIYVGPLGRNSCLLINYFEGIEGVKRIKDGYNPATWMLEVTTLAQEEILGINFAEIYRNSDLYRRNKALISELSNPPPGSKDLFFPSKYSQPFLAQCMACLWKQHKSYWRNPSYTATRIFFTTVIAFIFGTIFWACPVAWTLYGLVASQFGDYTNTMENGETVKVFIDRYFGFRHDFLGVVAVAVVGFALLFAFVFAFSIRVFNFQRR